LELVGQSNRTAPSLQFSRAFGMSPAGWMSLVSPVSEAFAVNWEYNLYAGVVVLVGGLAALLRWRDPVARGLALMVLLGAAIAGGNTTPLFGLLYNVIPGLSSFRIPARAGILVVFGLVCGATWLAGTKPWEQHSRKMVLLLGLLAVSALGCFYMRGMPPGRAGAAYWFQGQLALITAATAAWWYWLGRNAGDRAGVAWGRRLFLPAVLSVELGLSTWGLKHLPVLLAQFSDPSVENVVAAAIHARGLDRQAAPVRVCLWPVLIRENSGMIHHYATLTGYESLSLARVWNYLHRSAGVDPNHAFNSMPDGRVYDAAEHLGSVNLTISLPAGSGVLAINPNPDPGHAIHGGGRHPGRGDHDAGRASLS